MRILFTGASSFSGLHFVRALVGAGHTVVMPLRREKEAYEGLRKERVELLKPLGERIFRCTFGSDLFLDLVASSPWDLLCHHAADVTNYKSPDFDVLSAVDSNTHRLLEVITTLQQVGCNRMLLTGSVFEQGEGAGSDELRAVSPYGLSKGLTSEMVRYRCQVEEMHLGKFVIPNPFGPYEEARFTSYLMRTWLANETAHVATPAYVRDNIHVSLLAAGYAAFAARLPETKGFSKHHPSGYVESQGSFTLRFAEAMRPRIERPCEFTTKCQEHFAEPTVRINTERLAYTCDSEDRAWDAIAEYYLKKEAVSV